MGEVYLFHFNSPLGNLANPRAQAQHYTGFSDDYEARIAKQLAGKGAKIVAAALAKGLIFEIYHWPAPLASEKLIKRAKNTARYCPACAAAAGRRPRPIPIPPLAEQLAFDLDSDFSELPTIELGRMDWLEIKINQEWRAARVLPSINLAAIDELL